MKHGQRSGERLHAITIVGLTLGAGALFKCAAFAREAFIASHFGLTVVTDAYFGLQQIPLSLATFMFGAFALAFTPAYAKSKSLYGKVEWLPGLVFYGCLLGALLMGAMLISAPWLVRIFSAKPSSELWSTLAILSLCHTPIVFVGIWCGICIAQGRNVSSLTVAGLPYLFMTLALFGLYAVGVLNDLSLPISMTIGFGVVGLYSIIRIGWLQKLPRGLGLIAKPWKCEDFRRFLQQLTASALENGGYAGNQLLMLYSLSRVGTGALSASNFAMRIGTLGFTLFGQPVAQLVQAQLCIGNPEERAEKFRRWMVLSASGVALIALALFAFRVPIARVVYLRGKFQNTELNEVVSLMPAWLFYFTVIALNGFAARYMFIREQGSMFLHRQMWAYGLATVARFAFASHLGAAGIIWVTAAAQCFSFVLNMKSCLKVDSARETVPRLTASGEAY
jgi:putative peptidoglycan lipid II flippase